jgi:hypothetical protein
LPLRLHDAFEDAMVSVLPVTHDYWTERLQHFLGGLEEFRLTGITARHDFEDFCDVGIHDVCSLRHPVGEMDAEAVASGRGDHRVVYFADEI